MCEDEAHNREALSEMLIRMGHRVELATNGREGLSVILENDFDVVLTDLRMPEMDGLQLFDSVQSFSKKDPIFIFMTAYGTMDDAVMAMKKGALHFLAKPLRKKELLAVFEEAEKIVGIRKTQTVEESANVDCVAVSEVFKETVALIDRVASTHASVLLVGESGSGKEVLARRLHQKSSRNQQPFVTFHPGATPETLLESELFGYEKGAFTGAEKSYVGRVRSADKGTFFLDEISTMPLGTQAKLLRVLQDRVVTPLGSSNPIECDVRWVAATNVALEPMVERGQFREDLLYRLKVVVVDVPPLRNRKEDILPLTKNFLSIFAHREGRNILQLTNEVEQMLLTYHWPGNVRELQNLVERAVALADSDVFSASLLPDHVLTIVTGNANANKEIRIPLGSSLQSVEDRLIEETLKSCGGDKVKAAAVLGVAPRTIYRWLEKRN